MKNISSQLLGFLTEKAGEQAALFCYAPLREMLLLLRSLCLVFFFILLAPVLLVANSFYCLHTGIEIVNQGLLLWENPLWLTSAVIEVLTLFLLMKIFRKGFWLKKIAPLAQSFQAQVQLLNQREREREWIKDVVTEILKEKAAQEQNASTPPN
ncbi:MAG: hypothetical protein JNM93_01755 [Bacteriovoracaceae bacterium]|nr:hypothetical protein [Bacteriovoracaceae bacterium]